MSFIIDVTKLVSNIFYSFVGQSASCSVKRGSLCHRRSANHTPKRPKLWQMSKRSCIQIAGNEREPSIQQVVLSNNKQLCHPWHPPLTNGLFCLPQLCRLRLIWLSHFSMVWPPCCHSRLRGRQLKWEVAWVGGGNIPNIDPHKFEFVLASSAGVESMLPRALDIRERLCELEVEMFRMLTPPMIGVVSIYMLGKD